MTAGSETRIDNSDSNPQKGKDVERPAVCFTAGHKGAAFYAGVVHAWLASDRPSPGVVAGISTGAISAAAMQRAFRELTAAQKAKKGVEQARWEWFRRYVDKVTDRPYDVVWGGLPSPGDFMADRPPSEDLSCPASLRQEHARARERHYLLTRFGRWLSDIPLSVRSMGLTLVSYVRMKERYTSLPVLRHLTFITHFAGVVLRLLLHAARRPKFIRQWQFGTPRWKRCFGWIIRRPILGWRIWLFACLSMLLVLSTAVSAVVLVSVKFFDQLWLWPEYEFALFLPLVLLVILILFVIFLLGGPGGIWDHIQRKLKIERGLLHSYELHRALYDLFEGDQAIGEDPMPLLLVAAPLQGDAEHSPCNQQLWADNDANLITALRAATAVTPVFDPVTVSGDEIKHWIDKQRWTRELPDRLDLVDGAAIRRNPLPALFSYLRRHHDQGFVKAMGSDGTDHPGVYIAYSVPITGTGRMATDEADKFDIVKTALLSKDLAARRDTKLERRQTNFISRLVNEAHGSGPQSSQHKKPLLSVFAADIAPVAEIEFKNAVSPKRSELLEQCAEGCKQTLGRLYRERIQSLAPTGTIECHKLMRNVATTRQAYIAQDHPGLREVCAKCDKKVSCAKPPRKQSSGIYSTFGLERSAKPGTGDLAKKFSHLIQDDRPRIVFVASGGVFRGATHIGVLGAMQGMQVKPDLVVGASVGSLMGGALAAMSTLKNQQSFSLLGDLTHSFLAVDHKVALTSTLKNAARIIGVQARAVRVSPHQITSSFRRGASGDPTIGTIGAPAALLDAISQLFLIPYSDTSEIAAKYSAGHIAIGTDAFLRALRAETLDRLKIRYCLMGTSLIEPLARTLLGGGKLDLRQDQPFHTKAHSTSTFQTTTNLNRQRSMLLGRDYLTRAESYDYVQAALASSAFPAVFKPVREALLVPGFGRMNQLFSDGGMFDNLPFLPAIEILAQVQQDHIRSSGVSPSDALRKRHKRPDLIIAGALDVSATNSTKAAFANRSEIQKRASSLKNNLKIDAFINSSNIVYDLISDCLDRYNNGGRVHDPSLVEGAVNAGVLKIEPAHENYINPTFAFARTTGLKPKRVAKAVAHGCFQTLHSFCKPPNEGTSGDVLRRSLKALRKDGRVPKVRFASSRKTPSGQCPYFTINGKPHPCPFAAEESNGNGRRTRMVYKACATIPHHAKARQ